MLLDIYTKRVEFRALTAFETLLSDVCTYVARVNVVRGHKDQCIHDVFLPE